MGERMRLKTLGKRKDRSGSRGSSTSWTRLVLLGLAFFLAGFGFTVFQDDADAQLVAGHRNTPYPSQGIYWLSGSSPGPGWLYVGSSECSGQNWNTVTAGAALAEANSTIPGVWDTGLNLDVFCGSGENLPPAGTYNQGSAPTLSGYLQSEAWWDVFVWWDPEPRSFCQSGVTQGCLNGTSNTIGGRNISIASSSAHCAGMGTTSPCGVRGVIQMNSSRSYSSSAQWPRTMLHEFVHPFGLEDWYNCTTHVACNSAAASTWSQSDKDGFGQVYDTVSNCQIGVWLNDISNGSGAWYGPYGPGTHDLGGTSANQRASALWLYNGCSLRAADYGSGTGWSDSSFTSNAVGWNYYDLTNRTVWYNGVNYLMNNDISYLEIS